MLKDFASPKSLTSKFEVSLSLMLATAAKASTYTISSDVRRIRSHEVYELPLLLETCLSQVSHQVCSSVERRPLRQPEKPDTKVTLWYRKL